MCKKRAAAKCIPKLNCDGKILTEQRDIIRETGRYYKDVFYKKEMPLHIDNFMKEDGLSVEHPVLEEEMRDEMEKDITVDEISKSLKAMKASSSPGIDGFTAGWVKVFWRLLKMPFFNSVTHAHKTGVMSPTLRQGLISLLPKGKKGFS